MGTGERKLIINTCKSLLLLVVLANGAFAQFTLSYTYDLLNRISEVRYADRVIRYTYDDAGNRTGMTVETLTVAPAITTLSPRGALVGATGLTLRITGSGFTSSSVVQWNGENRTTIFIDANEVRIDLTPADIAAVGTASVVVVNSTPSLSVSNAQGFSIVQTAALSGRVTSSGAGLGNVTINLTGAETASVATDANGSFNFAVLNNGSYTLTPSRVNYTFTPASRPVAYSGVAQANLDFTAALVNYTIGGRVARSNGTGVAGVAIAMTGSQTANATTNSNGDYTLNALAEGNYTITPSLSGNTFTPPSFTFDNLSSAQTANFTAAAGNRAPFDYDNDGKTDFSVFRPSNGAWYLQRTTAGFYGTQFGAAADRLTPADYDGDGKTDIAVYRPSSGTWYILNSASNTVIYPVFGVAEDLPAPGDYDGDGKADLTVFRPSQGTWYRQNSSNGSFFGFQFGQSGDIPTVGDFDGDGKNDLGIWRPSIGDWYNIRSSNGSVFGERFGQTGDRIAPADYDGDGKTDIAIFRPSTGLWVVRNSATATYSYFVFGAPSDIPIAGDYDGDGKADIGVWRPSDGTWYISRSSNGQFIVFPWGQNGDKPTPSAFGN